ncbi:MAG: hypothetical protein GHCLOJNM_01259 [bacterium]|nr:hypothetical protein [bacterium]
MSKHGQKLIRSAARLSRVSRTHLSLSALFLLSLLLSGPTRAEEFVPAVVHDALAGALAENPKRVSSAKEVAERDQMRNSDQPDGIVDDLAVLEILSASTTQREKGIELRKLAKKMNDRVARERLLLLASQVEEVELTDLQRRRRLNQVTGVVNRAWQTTSEVLAGQPRALAVAGTDAVAAVTGRREPSVVDKKIGYLARMREAKGEATPEEIEKGRALVASLEERKSKTLLRSWKDSIKESRKLGERGRVERLSRVGISLWPEEREWFEEQLRELNSDDEQPSANELPAPQPADGLDDAGYGLIRKKILDSEAAPKAISVDSAKRPIGSALADRRSKTLNYLLFGESGFGVSPHGMARTAARHGTDAPAVVGLAQGVQTALRGVTLLFGNRLGLEESIDAYAKVDRENPEALSTEDYLEWADLCARADRYADALEILERKGIEDPNREEKYRAKWAAAIVRRSKELPAGPDRFKALKFVTESLSDTPSARKARELLEEMPTTERPVVQVSREDLRDYEGSLAQTGLRFQREWWDGDKRNGEIGEEGVYWDPKGSLWYRVGKRTAWREVLQDASRVPALSGLFTRINEEAIARRLADERGQNRKFPIEIEGATGPDSTYVTPKIVQFEVDKDEDGLFQ